VKRTAANWAPLPKILTSGDERAKAHTANSVRSRPKNRGRGS